MSNLYKKVFLINFNMLFIACAFSVSLIIIFIGFKHVLPVLAETHEKSNVGNISLSQEGISLIWSSSDGDQTNSIAWGDFDGDGDLHLATGSYGEPIKIYRNDGENLTKIPVWKSNKIDMVRSIVWGDINNDGYLDLVVEIMVSLIEYT